MGLALAEKGLSWRLLRMVAKVSVLLAIIDLKEINNPYDLS
jgi:GTPase involved in cell partitioning and DNA repair